MKANFWSAPTKQITRESADDFFGQELAEPYLFLFETSNFEMARHSGEFSIKTILSGSEYYDVDNRIVQVRPGTMLAVNGTQEYASQVTQSTRSLSVFFPKEALRELLCAPKLAGSIDHLDHKNESVPELPVTRIEAADDDKRIIGRLALLAEQGNYDAMDKLADKLLERTISRLTRRVSTFSSHQIRKQSTRDELVRRLCRAREYIEDMSGKECGLDQLAAIACLSKYHFCRLFKDAFGATPAVFARQVRMNEIHSKYTRDRLSNAVARQFGYSNLYALTRAIDESDRRKLNSN